MEWWLLRTDECQSDNWLRAPNQFDHSATTMAAIRRVLPPTVESPLLTRGFVREVG